MGHYTPYGSLCKVTMMKFNMRHTLHCRVVHSDRIAITILYMKEISRYTRWVALDHDNGICVRLTLNIMVFMLDSRYILWITL